VVHHLGERPPLLEEEGVGAGEDAQPARRDAFGDAAQVERRDDAVARARGGEHRDLQRAEPAVVAVAAQPGVLGGDLAAVGAGGDVEVVGDLAGLGSAGQATEEAMALALTVGRVELAQDRRGRGVGVAVDFLLGD
jgi:hypothetical protein